MLEHHGTIHKVEHRDFPPWVVWFETHEQALVAVEASKQHVLGLSWTRAGAVKPIEGEEYSATSKLAEELAIKTTFTQEELDGLLKASSIKFLKWVGFVCVKPPLYEMVGNSNGLDFSGQSGMGMDGGMVVGEECFLHACACGCV